MSTETISILTRVEGHGSVELIREGKKVVDIRLNMSESPRLFEALLVGRHFDEIADIACRICSICSTVHKVAALQAVEQAMGVAVSRQTALLRELAVQGGQIESHALHIFCLALPDYLGVPGIQELSVQEPEKLRMGLKIKKLGNQIQEVVGGRAIHPFNLLVGGVGKVPEADQLKSLGEQLVALNNDVAASIEYISELNDTLPQLALTHSCALSGGPLLFGDRLITSTGIIIAKNQAVAWLDERVEANRHAKVSRFSEAQPFMVGPLARLIMSMPHKYKHQFKAISTASFLIARVIELQQAVGQAQEIIQQLINDGLKKEKQAMVVAAKGEGTSLIEAPRGVLLHRYSFDDFGICRTADIITPTAINQMSMAATLKKLIIAMDGAEYNQLKAASEILIRCFDPCISCAVH